MENLHTRDVNKPMWTLYEGDCFDYLPLIEDQSVDMILCDLPYGTTDCKWDTPLPLDKLWVEYERVIKSNGAIVLTGSQPFTSHLVMSNPKLFRYEWIWEKEQGVNFLMVKKQPLKVHENVLIFSSTQTNYAPQMGEGTPYISGKGTSGEVTGNVIKTQTQNPGTRYPRSVLKINREVGLHPTQKPVALFEYLIRTYTNPGDVVLDNCAGSGTTGVACENTGRNSILMEKEEEYCQIIRQRLMEVTNQTKLPIEAK